MGVWTKNGKILVGNNGQPIVCAECPCGGLTCEESVDQEAARMLAERDEQDRPVWSLYGTYSPDFSCAAWHYDETYDEWVLDRTASGSLLVALKVGTTVTSTTNCVPSFLLYAKLLYSASQGLWHTVGCECVVQDHQCTHRKASLRDYSIAGVLPPWQLPEGTPAASYEPYMACQPDPCQVLKIKMQAAYYWHGGEWFGEGYYDWLLAQHGGWVPANINYWPFQMAIKWQEEVSESLSASAQPTQYLTYLACDCSGIATHTIRASEAVLEYTGACTIQDPCVDLLLLHNQAMFYGWIWHGEGALVHLANVTYSGTVHFGDWYAWVETTQWGQFGYGYDETCAYRLYRACAETPEGYWLVGENGCGCWVKDKIVYKIYNHELPASDTNPADYNLYLDLDGVCNCNSSWNGHGFEPTRELLLTYPDVFGVIDTCYGNHSKFDWVNDSTETDEWGNTHTYHRFGCDIFGNDEEPNTGHGGRTMFIDYRALCVVAKGIDRDGTECMMVRTCYPDGSPAAYQYNNVTRYVVPPTSDVYDGAHGFYQTVTIRGDHVVPFVDDDTIGVTRIKDGVVEYESYGFIFCGYNYCWWNRFAWHENARVNGQQPTETCFDFGEWHTREDLERDNGCNATTPIPCIQYNDKYSHMHRFAPLLSPDFTVIDQQPCNVRYDCPYPDEPYECRWCVTERWFTIGQNIGTDAWYMLNVCYVKTNKGLIVKGLDGYHETYTLIGVGNYSQYTSCWDMSEEDKQNTLHWNDEIIPCPADLDMHSCIGFDDWGFDGSDSGSEVSSSI